MGNAQNSIRKGWLLPSTRQWVWVIALSVVGYLLWQEYAANRVREQLWDSSASPMELIRASERWSKQGAEAVPTLIAALDNENPQTRRYAVMGLWRMGSAAARPAIPAVLQALKDDHPYVRREAICALAVLDRESESTLQAVSELLGDPDPSVQRETVTFLSNLGEPVVAIAKEGLSDSNPVARRLSLEVLSNVIKDRFEVARLAQPLTEDPVVDVQSLAIPLVFRASAATDEQIIKWLSHTEEPVRLLAVNAVDRDTPPLEAIKPLIGCIKRGPTVPAATSLQKFGTEAVEAVPALLEALKTAKDSEASLLLTTLQKVGCDAPTLADRSYQLARRSEEYPAVTAILILKAVDPKRARQEIDRRIEILRNGDSAAINRICQTFQSLPPEDLAPALPTLEELLFREEQGVHTPALRVIRNARAERSAPALARMLDAPEIDDMWQMAETIEAIGQKAAETVGPPLLRIIRGSTSIRPSKWDPGSVSASGRLRRRLMWTAVALGIRSPEFTEFLHVALNDPSTEIRIGALEALALIGGGDERVLKAFLQSLAADDPAIRAAATDCILDAVGPRQEVVEGLLPLLGDQERSVRVNVVITLARMKGAARSALVPLREALKDEDNDLPVGTRPPGLQRPILPAARLMPVPFRFSERSSVSDIIRRAIEAIEMDKDLRQMDNHRLQISRAHPHSR